MRHELCHQDEATIARALTGEWRDEHLFALRQSRELYRQAQSLIAACDVQIEATLKTWADREPLTPPERQLPPAKAKHRGRKKGAPNFDAHHLLTQKVGVDLTRIDGIDSHTALNLVSEIGIDVSAWPTGRTSRAGWRYVPTTASRPGIGKAAGRVAVRIELLRRCEWRRIHCTIRRRRWVRFCDG